MNHDFHKSLEFSRQHENAPWWLPVYREAFPTMESCVSVRDDGWAQRGGIDRVLTLRCGKVLGVDEKVRSEDYPDILLEYWSSKEHKRPGWVAKDLACDYLAYAFVPSQTCYLLPFQTLRQAWRRNHKEWVERYFNSKARNGTYTTVSVAVPIPVLMEALNDAMKVSWQ